MFHGELVSLPASYFGVLDLAIGYNLLKVSPSDKIMLDIVIVLIAFKLYGVLEAGCTSVIN